MRITGGASVPKDVNNVGVKLIETWCLVVRAGESFGAQTTAGEPERTPSPLFEGELEGSKEKRGN